MARILKQWRPQRTRSSSNPANMSVASASCESFSDEFRDRGGQWGMHSRASVATFATVSAAHSSKADAPAGRRSASRNSSPHDFSHIRCKEARCLEVCTVPRYHCVSMGRVRNMLTLRGVAMSMARKTFSLSDCVSGFLTALSMGSTPRHSWCSSLYHSACRKVATTSCILTASHCDTPHHDAPEPSEATCWGRIGCCGGLLLPAV
mmetsp:Transcript_66340/g.107623  ORF Transcript_66340/g.107623 Transcript_66340/m.107623 type:complete len:206 (+) Transcript_66340:51-668(+)